MEQITVKTRYFRRSFHSQTDYIEAEITGKLLNTIKWLTPDEIAVTNPNHPNGFSIIHKKNIVSMVNSAGKTAAVKLDDDYRQWTVKGSKGNEYLVIRQKGSYTCNCPGFQFRKNCRHIVEVGNE